MIWNSKPDQLNDGADQSLGLAQRRRKRSAQGRGHGDRQIRVDELITGLANPMALPGNVMAAGRIGFEWHERTYTGRRVGLLPRHPEVPQPRASVQQGHRTPLDKQATPPWRLWSLAATKSS